jgi:hypothetical protein
MASVSQSSSTANRRSNGATHKSGPILYDVLGIAGGLLRSQQREGAKKILQVSEAAHDFAAKISDVPVAAEYAELAAGSLSDLSSYLSHTTVDDIVSDLSRHARAHPATAVALAIVAGVVLFRSSGVTSKYTSASASPAQRRRRRTRHGQRSKRKTKHV